MASALWPVIPMSEDEFVDTRYRDAGDELDLDRLKGFDKLGDPRFGSESPGRCHACLAWVRHPYCDRTTVVCPDCHSRSEAEQDEVRRRVREALRDLWARGDDALARRRST